jgi:DNA (cytosine-5)-methyltransferase 1
VNADEIIVDLFAGGGGASTGIELALGRSVDVAINHNPAAIAVHRANHPRAHHHVTDVWDVDPAAATGGRPVGLLWASPDCTHHSRAKGGKPRRKRLRSLAWVVVRWARAVRPRVICLENVPEFEDWGPLLSDDRPCPRRRGRTFRAFVSKLRARGYAVEWRCLVAADYGAPTTRRRLFLVARCDGQPIAWPAPTHGTGRAAWRTAAEIIDWSLPCPSIFERRRPLAEATLRRIAAGLRRYVIDCAQPFIVPVTHPRDVRVHGLDEPLRTVTAANRGELALVTPFVASHYGNSVGRSVLAPVPTVTAGGQGHSALIAPTLVQTGYGERPGQRPRAPGLGVPLGTVVTDQKHALVAAFLTKHFGGVVGHGVDRPASTVTARDHHALTTAWLTKFYGTSTGAAAGAPVPTVTAGGGHGGGHLAEVRAFLVKYYGATVGQQQSLFDPLHTVTTVARFGLVMVHGEPYEIADIGMRMLSPRELFAAQGFPPDYAIAPEFRGRTLTKTSQIELAGNSVCPPVAQALIAAQFGRRVSEAA